MLVRHLQKQNTATNTNSKTETNTENNIYTDALDKVNTSINNSEYAAKQKVLEDRDDLIKQFEFIFNFKFTSSTTELPNTLSMDALATATTMIAEIKRLELKAFDISRNLVRRGKCACTVIKEKCKLCYESKRRMKPIAHKKTKNTYLSTEERLTRAEFHLKLERKDNKIRAARIHLLRTKSGVTIEDACLDENGNVRSVIETLLTLTNYGELGHFPFALYFDGEPVEKSLRIDGGGIEYDKRAARWRVSELLYDIARSKNMFNHFRELALGKAVISYSWFNESIRRLKIELNSVYPQATRSFIIQMVSKLCFYAGNCGQFTNNPEYRNFKGKRNSNGAMSQQNEKKLMIGEQLLKLVAGDQPYKKYRNLDDDIVLDALEIARSIIARLDNCHALVTQKTQLIVFKSELPLIAAKDAIVTQGTSTGVLIRVTDSILEEGGFVNTEKGSIEIKSASTFNTDSKILIQGAVIPAANIESVTLLSNIPLPTMTVQLIFYRKFWSYLVLILGLPFVVIKLLMSTIIHVDDVHVEQEEKNTGLHSVHYGACELPGPYITGKAPTEEGGMASASGMYLHVRFLLSCTKHLKANPGPVLAAQLYDIFHSFFHWTGIVNFVKGVCGDHATPNVATIVTVDACLNPQPDPRKSSTAAPGQDLTELFRTHDADSGTKIVKLVLAFLVQKTKLPKTLEKWIAMLPAVSLSVKTFGVLELRCISNALLNEFDRLTGFNQHYNSDPPATDRTVHLVRSLYDGRSCLDDTPVFNGWELGEIDDMLLDAHGTTETTEERLKKISSNMDGEPLKNRKNKWVYDFNSPTGGITAAELNALTSEQIKKIFKSIKKRKQKMSINKGAKIDLIKVAMKEPQIGMLEEARLLFYFILTYTFMALCPYLVCTVHLGKAMIALICRSNVFSPVYIRLKKTKQVKKLFKEMKKEEKKKKEDERAREAAEMAASTLSRAEMLIKRLNRGKNKNKDYDDDVEYDDQQDTTSTKTDYTTEHVVEPDECYAEIHGGLMIYLFTVVGAFIAAGLGNPCRHLKLTDWSNDPHGKMNARRLTNFINCIDFLEMIINDTWSDGKIPWDKLIENLPGLAKPTAKQKLGFIGLLHVAKQMKCIYVDFMLDRRFATREKLEAAKRANVEMLIEHLYFNPTFKSDRIKGYYFTRYQLEAQTSFLLFCEQKMIEIEEMNALIEGGHFSKDSRLLPKIIFKVGIWQNSTLENKIGQLRAKCRSGNLTGANLLFSFRRLMHSSLRLRGRMTPNNRRDYDQLLKDMQLFAAKEAAAEKYAVETLMEDLLNRMENLLQQDDW